MVNIPIKRHRPKRSKSDAQMSTSKAKPSLAEDFHNRCGYCDALDSLIGGRNVFHVDHFAPYNLFKNLEKDYNNFVYSCPYCNIAKSDIWMGSSSEENIVDNKGFIDPCSEEYGKNLARNTKGEIIFLTPLGEYIVDTLHLYLKRHKILFKLDDIRIKVEALEHKIDINKTKGLNTDRLQSLVNGLKIECYDYYTKLAPELVNAKN